MYRFSFALLVGASFLAPVGAGESLASLFDTQAHDFGNVLVGPTVYHDFKIKNTTNQTLHIGNLRVSCGCTTPSASTYTIEPGKTATINAAMDTRRFIGPKSVTIFVLFTQPQTEEVRLVVSAYGRNDMSMSPETLSFGQMRKGTSPTTSTQISLAGNTRITEASCESGYVQLSFKEPKQTQFGTSYELTAKMRSDIPVGKWYTDVWIKTDAGRVRIPLTVEVEPSLSITPGIVQFDATKVGQPSKKPIVVKGAQPFRILGVKGEDGTFTAVETSKGDEPKSTHLIMVTFKPGKEGDFAKALELVTDLKDENKVNIPVKGTGMK